MFASLRRWHSPDVRSVPEQDLTDVSHSVPVPRDDVPTEATSGFGPLKTLLETLSAVNVDTNRDVSLRSLQQGHT